MVISRVLVWPVLGNCVLIWRLCSLAEQRWKHWAFSSFENYIIGILNILLKHALVLKLSSWPFSHIYRSHTHTLTCLPGMAVSLKQRKIICFCPAFIFPFSVFCVEGGSWGCLELDHEPPGLSVLLGVEVTCCVKCYLLFGCLHYNLLYLHCY